MSVTSDQAILESTIDRSEAEIEAEADDVVLGILKSLAPYGREEQMRILCRVCIGVGHYAVAGQFIELLRREYGDYRGSAT